MNGQQTIKRMSLRQVMSERFSRYTKSIIQARAIPDSRDGLKPVQRRILYAMNKDGNIYSRAYRKSAKAVGNVLGNFHPHGDSSVYGALITLSQEWKMRVPLIDLHGNNGSIDDDPPAAMRYTEARLSKASSAMMKDIDKGTVSWVLNFDDTEYEPTVLPSRIPNLIVNGSSGIASGYATRIPPQNLGETIDALIYLQSHPDASLDEIMQFIKGPDFPTGGIVEGLDGLKQAYRTGRGQVVVRARSHIEKIKGGKKEINITQIPYNVNKQDLVGQINSIRINHKINGIENAQDNSDRHGLSIVVILKRHADAQGILNYLYKHTDLQTLYHFNVIAIDDNQPKRMSLKDLLMAYLHFQRRVVYRRTRYDLHQLTSKREIVRGFLKALTVLDQVVHLVRNSHGRADASNRLVKHLSFTPRQADAIVSLRLYRLTNTNKSLLQAKDQLIEDKANYCQAILDSPQLLDMVLRREFKHIKKEFATPRLTTIKAHVKKLHVSKQVTVPDEDVVVTVSRDGYVKRSSWRSYKASQQSQNGLKPGDYPLYIKHMNTRDHLFMFTNYGRVMYRPVNDIKEVRWKDTGQNISQSFKMLKGEYIIAVNGFKSLKPDGSFLIETSDGYIKRTKFSDVKPGRTYRHHAPRYEKLKHKDARVVNVTYLPKDLPDATVMLLSKYGFALRFQIGQVPVNGANASGVRSMHLAKGDKVTSLQLVNDRDLLGILTYQGTFNITPVRLVPVMNRDRKGNHLVYHTKLRWLNPIGMIKLNPWSPSQPLHIYTQYRRRLDIAPNDYSVDKRSDTRGKRVVKITKLGHPVTIKY